MTGRARIFFLVSCFKSVTFVITSFTKRISALLFSIFSPPLYIIHSPYTGCFLCYCITACFIYCWAYLLVQKRRVCLRSFPLLLNRVLELGWRAIIYHILYVSNQFISNAFLKKPFVFLISLLFSMPTAMSDGIQFMLLTPLPK